jgi:hypothetical protein
MSDVLRNAYGLLQAGRLAEAALAYDEIINADPLRFDTQERGESPASFAVSARATPIPR